MARAVPLLLIVHAFAGCGSDGEDSGTAPAPRPAEEEVEVKIASFLFVAEDVRVKQGGTVTWVNEDRAPHTAQTDTEDVPAEFDTGTLRLSDSKAITFDEPGTYEYLCGFHLFMVGTVEVVE